MPLASKRHSCRFSYFLGSLASPPPLRVNPPLASGLPLLRCVKSPLSPVAADPEAAPWPQREAVALRETVSGEPPLQATWIKSAWNEEELRLLFCIEDTQVWATLSERDALLYNEEVVEVFLAPSGDLATYFEIEVNPLNAVLDLSLARKQGEEGWKKDFQWRCEGLRTAVRKGPAGWVAELSIPFAALGASPQGKPWRANFYRIDRPSGAPWELSAWSPTGAPTFHVPERFGALEFVE